MAQHTFTIDDQPFLFQCLLRCGFANVGLGLAFFAVLTPPMATLWQGTATDWVPLLMVLTSTLGLSRLEARTKNKYFPVFQRVSLGAIVMQSLPVVLLHFAILAESTQSCGFFTAPLIYYGIGLLGLIALTFKTSPFAPPHPLFQRLRYVSRGVFSFIFALSLYGVLTMNHMHCGKDSISNVKAHMHTLQTLVEAYRADKKGLVPQNLAALRFDQSDPDFDNTYLEFDDFVPGKKPAFQPFLGFRLNPNHCCVEFALYKPLSATDYAIYGSDQKGHLILHRGQPLILSAQSH